MRSLHRNVFDSTYSPKAPYQVCCLYHCLMTPSLLASPYPKKTAEPGKLVSIYQGILNHLYCLGPKLETAKQSFTPTLQYSTPTKKIFDIFQSLLTDFIPQEPSYNFVLTRAECRVVKRVKGSGGLVDGFEGRCDGARLLGISV